MIDYTGYFCSTSVHSVSSESAVKHTEEFESGDEDGSEQSSEVSDSDDEKDEEEEEGDDDDEDGESLDSDHDDGSMDEEDEEDEEDKLGMDSINNIFNISFPLKLFSYILYLAFIRSWEKDLEKTASFRCERGQNGFHQVSDFSSYSVLSQVWFIFQFILLRPVSFVFLNTYI